MSYFKGRRTIHWQKVRNLKTVFALLVSSGLGAGLLPLAPGTMGTLAALPLAYYTAPWSLPSRVAFWLGLTIAGVWAAKVFDETMQTSDNQNIVIDEVIGLGITAWTAGQNLKMLAAAFILFRFFDILKPPPVRQLDLWSKKKASENQGASRWWGGIGVIADDVVAGFQGLAVILILQTFQVL